jgi:Ca-activated chloride channel family protein
VTFLWPEAIVFALVVPVFLWLYIRLEKQRHAAVHQRAALYPHSARPEVDRPCARHVPLILFLASLTMLSVALARPQALMTIFAVRGTAVLAVDVSTSMTMNDALPSRLARSQALAREFIAKHSDELRIGLVSFGGNAVVESDPTTDREELFRAIDRLAPRPGTAIGSGIATALSMIFPEAGIDTTARNTGRSTALSGGRIDPSPRAQRADSTPGSYSAAAIVLLSDGQSGRGHPPIEVARLAADLGVRVHTIGIGSIEGRSMSVDGWSMRVRLDEAALKEIATATHGKYFSEKTGIDWRPILGSIRTDRPPEETYTEITALFAVAAAAAAIAGALLSLTGTKRIL